MRTVMAIADSQATCKTLETLAPKAMEWVEVSTQAACLVHYFEMSEECIMDHHTGVVMAIANACIIVSSTLSNKSSISVQESEIIATLIRT